MRAVLMLSIASLAGCHASVVLVTGATGRSGSLVYAELKKQGTNEVRALVSSVDKAKDILNCNQCDESEGIFIGDVTKPETLAAAFKGVDAVIDAVGVPGSDMPEKTIEAVEFEGVKNQVAALGGNGHFLMISAEGTHGDSPNIIEQYKRKAEDFVSKSGVAFTIVEPCGLSDEIGSSQKLLVGHDDTASWESTYYMVPRADVARLLVEAVKSSDDAKNLRFDFCGCDPDDSQCPSTIAPGDYLSVLQKAKEQDIIAV